ncbi:MAG: hypothetical protein Q8O40_15895 [Chloroflexota bacterium]|nr:hypothetical protein [Chloroflexota bacterium]
MPDTGQGLLRETVQPASDIEAQPTPQSQPRVERVRSGVPWAERVSQEMDAVSATLCAAVGETRARLLALVQEEIRRGLEQALENARVTLIVPAVGAALDAARPLSFNGRQVPDDGSSGPPTEDEPKASPPSLWVVEEAANAGGAEATAAESAASSQPETNGVSAAPVSTAANGAPGAPADEMLNGAIRLVVEADGSVRRVVRFVDDLCQKPQFRLLRLVGSRQKTGVEIWLGLREPVNMTRALSQMRNVSHVAASDELDGKDNERCFNVWLAEEASVGQDG